MILNRTLCFFFLFFFSAFFCPPPLFSESGKAAQREYSIKAGFIYNFTKFIQWPESSFSGEQDKFVIGILGEDPFEDALDLLERKKKTGGREIAIQRFSSLRGIKKCQVLFVSSSEKNYIEKITRKFADSPVLLLGDTPGFAEKGIGINFYTRQNKVRFEFNRKALERAGIKVSSQLLNLGRMVE